ncbi:MAG TPA: hypothetical protein VGJ39_06065 [Vicinamibacterales bacterium]
MSDVTSTIECPRAASLDGWAEHEWTDGLQVDRLRELDELSVRTRNNLYRIVAIVPLRGEVMVQGGRFFPEPTHARLAGCSLGGAFLKQRGIYVGFRIELQVGLQTIVTSDVQSIEIVSGGRAH